MTNALLLVRQQLDPSLAPPAPQNVAATSAAYGVYMSISSNLRYQVRRRGGGRAGVEVGGAKQQSCMPSTYGS